MAARAHPVVQALRAAEMPLPWRLVLLMLAVGFSEGVGLVLLVPMLALLSSDGRSSQLGRMLSEAGIPLDLGPLLALFAVLVLLRACLVAARSLAEARYQSTFVNRLRRRAWQALLRCDWRAAIRMHRAQTTALLISNIDRLGTAMYQALQVAAGAATLAVLLAATLLVAPLLASSALLGGGLVLLAYRRSRRDAALLGERVGEAYDAIHSTANEGLAHLRAIKSLGLERQFLARAEAAFADLTAQLIAFTRRSGTSAIILQGGGAIVLAAGIWSAVRWGGAGLATIVPLAALAVRALPLLGQVQASWQNFVFNGGVAAQTLSLIAEAEAGAEAAPEPGVAAPRLTRSLSLEGVTVRFAGQGRPAVADVNLLIPVRSCLAIEGPSGAGKSTVADLAGGLIAPDVGTVSIDDVVLEGGARQAWRTHVSYVHQDAMILSGSLRDNLLLAAPEADDAALVAALEQASARFALAWPDGLGTVLGDGGRGLSGGERQRIALARALLRNPDLLILDEATSALDASNETAVAEAIAALKGKVTILIIGHRGALGDLADRKVRLENGRIA